MSILKYNRAKKKGYSKTIEEVILYSISCTFNSEFRAKNTDLNFSFENFKRIYKKYMGKAFDDNDPKVKQVLFNKNSKLVQYLNIQRDVSMILKVLDSVCSGKYKKILIVTGRYHAIIQEKVYKKIAELNLINSASSLT